MIIYLAKTKHGENVTIRAFKTKTSATKAAKEAQEKLYTDMEYNKTHDMQVDAVVVKADPDVKHKKEKVTTAEGKDIYYVDVYGKDGTFYFHKFAGYVKRLVVEY